MFHVGQKVVRFRDTPEHLRPWSSEAEIRGSVISVGQVVVIRDIDARSVDCTGELTLRFEGIFRPIILTLLGQWEQGFPACCFRPVIERKTDISIFTAMFNRTPETVG